MRSGTIGSTRTLELALSGKCTIPCPDYRDCSIRHVRRLGSFLSLCPRGSQELSEYRARLTALNRPGLVTLDDWMWKTLPKKLRELTPHQLTHEQLCKVMKWKLTRGKFRPRLQELAASNPEDLIQVHSSLFV